MRYLQVFGLLWLLSATAAFAPEGARNDYKILEISEGCSYMDIYVSTPVRDSATLATIAHDVIVANKRKQFLSSHFVVFRNGDENFAWAYVADVKKDQAFTCSVDLGYTPYVGKMEKSMKYLKELHPDYQTKEWYMNGVQLMSIVVDPSGQLYLNVAGHERVRLFKLTQSGSQYSFEQPAANRGNLRQTETIVLRRNRFQDLQFIVQGAECAFGFSNLMHRVR